MQPLRHWGYATASRSWGGGKDKKFRPLTAAVGNGDVEPVEYRRVLLVGEHEHLWLGHCHPIGRTAPGGIARS